MAVSKEAGDGVVGDETGDLRRHVAAVGPEPVSGPVERAEKSPGGDDRVGRAQRAAAHPFGDEGADGALVAIALGDNHRAEATGQGIDLEMGGAALDLVEQTEDVGFGERAQPIGQRTGAAPGGGGGGEQPLERAVLAEIEQFVLAAEVVIEVAGREIGGEGDVAHPGAGEAAGAEDTRRRAQDGDTAGVGAA
jgi:hypothetical protein